MKATIGFGFFLLFLAGIALVTLKGRQMVEQGMPGGGAGLTAVNWRPVIIGNAAMPEDSGMYISFEVDGSIKGHGGCNGFFGSLQKTESGIKAGPLGATRIVCDDSTMNRETDFFDAVQETTSFQITTGTMRLLNDKGYILAEFVGDPKQVLGQ